MKRLIKKANEEMNQKMIDYFKNQSLFYSHWYYFQRYNDYGPILHNFYFYMHFGYRDSNSNTKDGEDILEYTKKLKEEFQSNQLSNIKTIIEAYTADCMQNNKHIHCDENKPLQFFDESSFQDIKQAFQNDRKTLKEQGINSIPYTFSYSDSSNDRYSFFINCLIEYNQTKEEHIDQQNQVQEQTKEYIKNFLNETDFIKEYFFNKQNTIVSKDTLDEAIFKLLRFSSGKRYEKIKGNLHIQKYFAEKDFLKQFKDFFIQEAIEVMKNKLWNESNIIQKQMIRHFIKQFGNEAI